MYLFIYICNASLCVSHFWDHITVSDYKRRTQKLSATKANLQNKLDQIQYNKVRSECLTHDSLWLTIIFLKEYYEQR